MKRSILFVVLAAVLLLPVPVYAAAPDVSAEAYVLTDAVTGAILSSRAPDEVLPMASTTKIMTCLVAIRNTDIYRVFTVPKEAVGVEGSSMYLFAGERLTILDLLYGLMLESANDAAVAIAIAVSGSVKEFVLLMNETATTLGMEHTRFANPHGLPAEGHASSAADLALLFREALTDPVFSEIVATLEHTFEYEKGKTQLLRNHNRLLRTDPDCIGGKTGYTVSAGRCLVTAARRDGAALICVTLNAPDDWRDHRALYEYGFSLYEKKIFEPGEISAELPVIGGTVDLAAFSNRERIELALRRNEPFEIRILSAPYLYAPVDEKVQIQAVVEQSGEVARLNLTPQNSVARLHTPTFFEKFKKAVIRLLN